MARHADRAARRKFAGIMSMGKPSATRARACSRNTAISRSFGGSPSITQRLRGPARRLPRMVAQSDDGYPGVYSYLAINTSPDAVRGPGSSLAAGSTFSRR